VAAAGPRFTRDDGDQRSSAKGAADLSSAPAIAATSRTEPSAICATRSNAV
jgi:hypothetical protein